MQNRDIWKMIHLLYQHGDKGVPLLKLEAAGFDCGRDAVRSLADGDAVVAVGAEGPRQRLTLSKAANHILANCIVANRGPTGSLVQVDRPVAFVIMPFGEKWSSRVFRELIGKALASQRIDCIRGDMTLRVRDLTANVWGEILASGFVVADLSVPNPNVYYELGLAHALGRDTFILKQRGVMLPADFGGAHYVEYELADLAAGRKALAGQVADWARTVETRRVARLCGAASGALGTAKPRRRPAAARAPRR